MKYTISISTLSIFILLLSTLTSAQSHCPATLKSPRPPTRYCGASKQPVPDTKSQKALLYTSNEPNQKNCQSNCFVVTSCRTFTYNAETKKCNLYKYAPPLLSLQRSTDGTRFWNTQCYDPPFPQRFYIQISSGTYAGQYVYPYLEDTRNKDHFRATFEEAFYGNPEINIPSPSYTLPCTANGSGVGGNLTNLEILLPAVQVFGSSSDGQFDYTSQNVVFVTEDYAKSNDLPVQQVTCSITDVPNNGQYGRLRLGCNSSVGDTIYACVGQYASLQIAPSSGPNGLDETCEKVTLSISRAAVQSWLDDGRGAILFSLCVGRRSGLLHRENC